MNKYIFTLSSKIEAHFEEKVDISLDTKIADIISENFDESSWFSVLISLELTYGFSIPDDLAARTQLAQSVFDKNSLGDARSKFDKQLKAVIIKKIFGTTSNIEIEKMDAAQLNHCRALLQNYSNPYQPRNPKILLSILTKLIKLLNYTKRPHCCGLFFLPPIG